jgi:spiro-SPASM protein
MIMSTILLLELDDTLTDADLSLAGRFVPDILEERLAGIGEIRYSLPRTYQGQLASRNAIRRGEGSVDEWISLFESTDASHIVILHADAPFLDPDTVTEMLSLHTTYLAEFTYSENLPTGLGCEIFSRDIIALVPETEGTRLPLSKVVKGNINQFDVELYYRSPDLRGKRMSFRCGNVRERAIMERIASRHGGIPSHPALAEIIETHPELLYLTPSWYEVEITTARVSETVCTAPRPAAPLVMNIDAFRSLITQADSAGFPYAISLAGRGDPLCHTAFLDFVSAALHSTVLEMLVIETDALPADQGIIEFFRTTPDPRIRFIAEINGHDNATYTAIHRGGSFEKALTTVRALGEILPSSSVYVQIQKIRETESFLDRYYDFWEQEHLPIILMKQNTWLGMVEDRRYYDLSPLERTPCWHLLRDLYIQADGRIPFCKQDIGAQAVSGSLGDEPLSAIIERRRELYLNDCAGNYPACPDCRSCDEWYTFNH